MLWVKSRLSPLRRLSSNLAQTVSLDSCSDSDKNLDLSTASQFSLILVMATTHTKPQGADYARKRNRRRMGWTLQGDRPG